MKFAKKSSLDTIDSVQNQYKFETMKLKDPLHKKRV
jgi:hypothetical protein